MATKVRIKLNQAGIINLLLSDGVQDDIAARTRRIAAAAGDGFDSEVTENRDRVVGFVTTATNTAREAEAESRALTRAINAGR